MKQPIRWFGTSLLFIALFVCSFTLLRIDADTTPIVAPTIVHSDPVVIPGQTFDLTVRLNDANRLVGYQMQFYFDASLFELLSLAPAAGMEEHTVFNLTEPGVITINHTDVDFVLTGDVPLFTLSFAASPELTYGWCVDVLWMNFWDDNAIVTMTEAYDLIETDAFYEELASVCVGKYGDVNGDGKVSILDIGLTQLHLAGIRLLSPSQMMLADVNLDGSVSILDVGLMQLYLADLRSYLGPKPMVSLRYQVNGGSYLPSQTMEVGAWVDHLPIPWRDGHRFDQWYLDPGLMIPFVPMLMPESGLTVFAGWIEDATDYAQALYYYVADLYGYDPYDQDYMIYREIETFQFVFETVDPYTLLNRLVPVAQTVQEMMFAQTLEEAQTGWEKLIVLGIDEEFVVDLIIRMMQTEVYRQLEYSDPVRYDRIIQELTVHIDWLESEIDSVEQDLFDFCNQFIVDQSAICFAYYDVAVELRMYILDNLSLRDQMWNEFPFYDDGLWMQMRDSIFRYYNGNFDRMYFDQYLDILNSIPQELQEPYQILAEGYLSEWEFRYYVFMPLRDELSTMFGENTFDVRSTIQNYATIALNILQELRHVEGDLQWHLDNYQDAVQRHQRWLYFHDYLNTEETLTRVKLGLISVYDMMEHVMYQMDPHTYEFMRLIVMNMQFVDPSQIDGAFFQQMIGAMASMGATIEGGFDETDIANFQQLARDFAYGMIMFEPMDEAQKAFLYGEILTAIDEYPAKLLLVAHTMRDFMTSITPEQWQTIVDAMGPLLYQFSIDYGYLDPATMIELAWTIVDVLTQTAIPFEADLIQAMSILLEIKYDLSYQFAYDPVILEAVQTELALTFSAMLDLTALLGPVDWANLTPEQAVMVDELISRGEYFLHLILSDPWDIVFRTDFGYNPEHFETLLGVLHNDVTRYPELMGEAKLLYMNTFGMSEENTYYFMLSMAPSFIGIRSINSFTDIQALAQSLDRLGMTNRQIAELVVAYAANRSVFESLRYRARLQEETAWVMEQIASYQQQQEQLTLSIAQANLQVDLWIEGYDEADQALLVEYWNYLPVYVSVDRDYFDFFHQYLDQNDLWDLYGQDDLMYQLENTFNQLSYLNRDMVVLELNLNHQIRMAAQYCDSIDPDFVTTCHEFVAAHIQIIYEDQRLWHTFDEYVMQERIIPDHLFPMYDWIFNLIYNNMTEAWDVINALILAEPEESRRYYQEMVDRFYMVQALIFETEDGSLNLIDSEGDYVADRARQYGQIIGNFTISLERASMMYFNTLDQINVLKDSADPDRLVLMQPILDRMAYRAHVKNYLWDYYQTRIDLEIDWMTYEQLTQLYMNEIRWLQEELWVVASELDWLEDRLAFMDDHGDPTSELILSVLEDPSQEVLAVDTVEILIDQLDALMTNLDPVAFDRLMNLITDFVDDGTIASTPEAIQAFADHLAFLIALMQTELEITEVETIRQFVEVVIREQMALNDAYVEEIDATVLYFNQMFASYVPRLYEIGAMLSAYLGTMTLDDAAALMTILGDMAVFSDIVDEAQRRYYWGEIDYVQYWQIRNQAELGQTVLLARFVTLAVANGVLDYDLVIETILMIAYDIEFEYQLHGDPFVDEYVLHVQNLADALLVDAALLAAMDPFNLNEIEINEVQAWQTQVIEWVWMLQGYNLPYPIA